MESLAAVFLSHYRSDSSDDAGALPALVEEVDRAARAAWPQLALAPERFVAYVAARIPEGSDLAAALKDIHAADLFLACACVEGVPGATEAFRAHTRTAVETFVRSVDPTPAAADEVEQALLEKLLVASNGEPARLTAYAGRGPLAGWMGVAAQRAALSLRRGESAQARARERAAMEELSLANDAELAYLKQRYRTEYEAALAKAAALLSDRERAILRLHLSGGLTLQALGAMYRVNASTIYRWITAAQARLAAETEKDLRQRLRLSATELHSLTRLVITQLDFSVGRLLPEKPPQS